MTGPQRRRLAAFAGVLALWSAAVAAVGTSGEFPLSDDWAYAHVVRSLCEGRGFDFLPWTGASLVVQALYGAAACRVGSFSYETLRWTTLAMSALGLSALYALLLELGTRRIAAAFATTAVALSPLWFNLSFTFMTDVPFAALALVSSYLYVRALAAGSRRGLAAAGAACAIAFLVRQHALSIAAAGAVAALVPPAHARRGASEASSPASRLADAGAALAAPLLVAVAYAAWVSTSPDVPLAVHNKLGEAASVAPLAMAGAGFRALATLGFLFVPYALALGSRQPYERRVLALTASALAALALFLFVREGDAMFYLTNVLGERSVGAVTTRDALFLALPGSGTDGAFRFSLTALSLLSAAVLVARLATALPQVLRHRKELVRASVVAAAGSVETFAVTGASWSTDGGRRAAVALFCVLAFVLSALGTLVQAHYYFDRYLVPLLPLAVAAVAAVTPALRPRPVALVAAAAMIAYSVAGTHDYLAWNRARWELLDGLEARGVDARQIDGGVEYNASRLAAELRTSPTDAEARSGQAASAKSWWWVVDDRWIVAFTPLDGYREVDARPYARWLPPAAEGRVLLLERRKEN